MSSRHSVLRLAIVLGSLALSEFSAAATAPVIDGTRDAVYGSARVTQTTQTQFNDTEGSVAQANGWELDAAYGFVSNGVLYLMFTGIMALEPDAVKPATDYSPFELFLDSRAGGQNTLSADNPNGRLYWLSGLTFDTDFSADYWLGCYGSGGPDFSQPYRLQTYFAELPADSAASQVYLGSVEVGVRDTLSGGANPGGVRLALDNSNTGGVGQGCGAASGANVATGFECAIPLAAIGNPTGPIKVCAFYGAWGTPVSNQVAGPVPAGTCALGDPTAVNFSSISGNQYFIVSPATDAVPPAMPAGLWLAPRTSPGAGLSVTYSLPFGTAARLAVIDAGGRRVLSRVLEGGGSGAQTLELVRAGELPAGVYFIRLEQGAGSVTAQAVITR